MSGQIQRLERCRRVLVAAEVQEADDGIGRCETEGYFDFRIIRSLTRFPRAAESERERGDHDILRRRSRGEDLLDGRNVRLLVDLCGNDHYQRGTERLVRF